MNMIEHLWTHWAFSRFGLFSNASSKRYLQRYVHSRRLEHSVNRKLNFPKEFVIPSVMQPEQIGYTICSQTMRNLLASLDKLILIC